MSGKNIKSMFKVLELDDSMLHILIFTSLKTHVVREELIDIDFTIHRISYPGFLENCNAKLLTEMRKRCTLFTWKTKFTHPKYQSTTAK